MRLKLLLELLYLDPHCSIVITYMTYIYIYIFIYYEEHILFSLLFKGQESNV